MATQVLLQQVNSPRSNTAPAGEKSDLYGHPVENGGGSEADDKSQFSSVLKGEMGQGSESSKEHTSEPPPEEPAVSEEDEEGVLEDAVLDGDITQIEAELEVEGGGSSLPLEEVLEGELLPVSSSVEVGTEEVVDEGVLQSTDNPVITADQVRAVETRTDASKRPIESSDLAIKAEGHERSTRPATEKVLVDEGQVVAKVSTNEDSDVTDRDHKEKRDVDSDPILKEDLHAERKDATTLLTPKAETKQIKPETVEVTERGQEELKQVIHLEKEVKGEVAMDAETGQRAEVVAQTVRGDEAPYQPVIEKSDKKITTKIDRSSVVADQSELKRNALSIQVEEERELESEAEFEESFKKVTVEVDSKSNAKTPEDTSQSSKPSVLPMQTDLKAASRYKAMDAVPVSTGIKQPVGQPGWNEALSDRVMVFVNERVSTAQIHLEPAQLGPIQIKISMQNDLANVVFVSHSAVTRESIESAIPRLREAFEQNGINLADVNVEHQESQARHSARQSQFEEEGEEAEPADGELVGDGTGEGGAVEPGQLQSSSLVDYYV